MKYKYLWLHRKQMLISLKHTYICPSWNSLAWFRCFMGVFSSDPENHIELLPNQNARSIDV